MDSDQMHWLSEHKGMLILSIIALILIFYFLFPFLDGLILGIVFAYVGRPISEKFRHRRLGALVATICIVVPVFLIFGLGMLEVANQIIILAQNQETLRYTLGNFMEHLELDIPPAISDAIANSWKNAIELIVPIVTSIPIFHIGRVVSLVILNFIICIPVCYFVLLDGKNLVDSIFALLPEKDVESYRKYTIHIDRIMSGIFIGSIYTSILGSLIAAVIFYVFGLPRPFALASIVFIAGMVPIVTAWIVIIPVTLYRFFIFGSYEALIFFVVASALIYIPSELIIRPYLVSYKSSIHPMLVMLSFLGGALVAGIGGFFLAPAIMGVIIGIYQVRVEEIAARKAANSVAE